MDFNGAPDFSGGSAPIDWEKLSSDLALFADRWVPDLFPHGRRGDDPDEWRMADISGRAPRKRGSCIVWLKGDHAGSWCDYVAPGGGKDGGGPLSTLKHATGLSGADLAAKAVELTGGNSAFVRNNFADMRGKTRARVDGEIDHVLHYAVPIAGTDGEKYLRHRGISMDLDQVALLFNPTTSFSERDKPTMAVPAIVGRFEYADGGEIKAVHRIYLEAEGRGHRGKKMLGSNNGAVIKLAPIGPENALAVAEGIENALAVIEQRGLPCWSTASAGGFDRLAHWVNQNPGRFPRVDLLVCPDAGEAGEISARRFHDAAKRDGLSVRWAPPVGGDDPLDDLVEGRQPSEPVTLEVEENKQAAEMRSDIWSASGECQSVGLGPMAPAPKVFNIGADEDPIPPRAWLLGNRICRGYATGLIAAGGGGKTTLAIADAVSSASGRKLSGAHVFHRSRVLIISLEDDRDEMRRRVRAAMKHHQVNPSELDDRLLLWQPIGSGSPKLGVLVRSELDGTTSVAPGALYDELVQLLKDHQPDVVIIDPWIHACGVPESNNDMVADVMRFLTYLAHSFRVGIYIIHHEGKSTFADAADRARGASAFVAALRMAYALAGINQQEAEQIGAGPDEWPYLVRIDNAKNNLLPPAAEATWFKLVGVNLDNPSDLYPHGDSVQAIEPWSLSGGLFRGLSKEVLNRVLDALDAGPGDGRTYSAASNAKDDRKAWRRVHRMLPELGERRCQGIIAAWKASGLILTGDYMDPVTRKTVGGIKIDNTRRPG
jgi:hypothetical protein